MNILCSLFGHKPDKGWYGDGPYGEVGFGAIDGIGRAHGHISAKCDRCGERYTLARLHLNSPSIMNHLAKYCPDDLRAALLAALPEREGT